MAKSLSDRGFLVVEDDPQALGLVTMVLEDMGVGAVFTADDGEKAWQILESHRGEVDVVLADWNLPGLSGIDLLKRVRESGQRMAFIMITGRNSLESAVEASTSGANYYLFKPFTPENLRIKVYAAATDLSRLDDSGG